MSCADDRQAGNCADAAAGPARAPGRPPDPEKIEAAMDAGWALFLERGLEGTTMEAIATHAGIAKVTLYKHFPDKAALFEACVRRESERIEAAQQPAPDAAPDGLEGALRRFGMGLVSFLVSDTCISFYSVLVGELRRHPDLASRFYWAGPGKTRARLAAMLAEAGARGKLAIDDPEVAAEHLLGLWLGMSHYQLALGILDHEIRDTVAARVDDGLRAFLNAYRPPA